MEKRKSNFQKGVDAGRMTADITREVLLNNTRQSGETQEQYTDRIMGLIGARLIQVFRVHLKPQD
jgi:hypothetical protein